jgi:hypothetical protein
VWTLTGCPLLLHGRMVALRGDEEEGPLRENIEVLSSHVGMGYNPVVLFVTTDRLAQPEGTWRPYPSAARRR